MVNGQPELLLVGELRWDAALEAQYGESILT